MNTDLTHGTRKRIGLIWLRIQSNGGFFNSGNGMVSQHFKPILSNEHINEILAKTGGK